MLPHLSELGMGAGGRGGFAFEGSFRFRGCRNGSWSGLPITQVTKEDDNSSRMCVTLTAIVAYDRGENNPWKIFPSAAMKAAQTEVWLSSECIGVSVLGTYCFYFWGSSSHVFSHHFHHLPSTGVLWGGGICSTPKWRSHWEHDGKVQILS